MLPLLRVISAVTAATMPGLVGAVDDQAGVVAQSFVVHSHGVKLCQDSGCGEYSRAHSDVASRPPNV